MGRWEHGSKGLCQERAFVSGIQAANALARSGSLGIERKFKRGTVLPVRDDEIQVRLFLYIECLMLIVDSLTGQNREIV